MFPVKNIPGFFGWGQTWKINPLSRNRLWLKNLSSCLFWKKNCVHVQNYWLQIISLKKLVSFVIIWFSHLWKSIVFLLTAQCVASSGVSGAWFPSFFWPLFCFLPSVGPAWSLLVWTHCWLISGLASRVTTGCFSDSYFSDRCLELFHSKCRILHFLVNLLKLLRVYIYFFFFFALQLFLGL